MARSKSFDPADKLESAMYLFWRQGFEGTSLENLEAELGLKRFSIYNAFGDKLSLYRQALALYIETVFTPSLQVLNTPGGLAGISLFIDRQLDSLRDESNQAHCFVFKAALEMERHDAEVALLTRTAHEQLRECLASALRREQAMGRLSSLVEPESSSRWLLTIQRGLVTSHGIERDPKLLDDFKYQFEQLLTAWQMPDAIQQHHIA